MVASSFTIYRKGLTMTNPTKATPDDALLSEEQIVARLDWWQEKLKLRSAPLQEERDFWQSEIAICRMALQSLRQREDGREAAEICDEQERLHQSCDQKAAIRFAAHAIRAAAAKLSSSDAESVRAAFRTFLKEVQEAEGDYGIGLAMTKAEKFLADSMQTSAAKLLETRDEIPHVLFDGYAVYSALSEQAKTRTGHENVADTLDAVVCILRAASKGTNHA
jgi:hypothetical protein